MIKILSLTMFSVLSGINCYSQSITAPGTEGGWEANEIKKIFCDKNAYGHYRKYRGDITVKGDSVFYSSEFILVQDPYLKELLKLGIFYPNLLMEAPDGSDPKLKITLIPAKREQETATSKIDTTPLRKISLSPAAIGAFEELKTLETTTKKRRFRFLVYAEGILNATLYVAEFTNNRAKAQTDEMTFLKGAKVTLIRQVTILI